MTLFDKPKAQFPLQIQAEFMGIDEKTATELIIYIRTSVIQIYSDIWHQLAWVIKTHARQRTPVDGEESCFC